MKPTEAEKVMGGYATGTLTEAERTGLFAAALEHQEIFDALADEEALRELLADPVAKAQLLAALAPTVAPKVVPFWRRTGVLGAAASLIVAATAGLAYLRNPIPKPPPLQEQTTKATKAAEAPGVVTEPVVAAQKAPGEKGEARARPLPTAPAAAMPTGMPKPGAAPAPAAAQVEAPRLNDHTAVRQAEAQDGLAKKAEVPRAGAPRPAASSAVAAAALEVIASQQEASRERKQLAPEQPPRSVSGGVPGGVPGGAIGGVVGGVVGGVAAPSAVAKAKRDGWGEAAATKGSVAPRWTVEPIPEGRTRVTVLAPKEALLVLLKRGPAGVAVLRLQPQANPSGESIPWRCEVYLAADEVLDLYSLNHPAPEPVKLPETGPVDGFRVRIHP